MPKRGRHTKAPSTAGVSKAKPGKNRTPKTKAPTKATPSKSPRYGKR